jgi:hypothetical protein
MGCPNCAGCIPIGVRVEPQSSKSSTAGAAPTAAATFPSTASTVTCCLWGRRGGLAEVEFKTEPASYMRHRSGRSKRRGVGFERGDLLCQVVDQGALLLDDFGFGFGDEALIGEFAARSFERLLLLGNLLVEPS